MMARPGMT